MKSPGRLITYTGKDGNIQFGRTYNDENLVNGKVVVHLMNDNLELMQDEKGGPVKRLVSFEKIQIKGFID